MTKYRTARDNLIRICGQHLKKGNHFYLRTSRKEYWQNVIERDIRDCTIEDWDDGLVVRGKG